MSEEGCVGTTMLTAAGFLGFLFSFSQCAELRGKNQDYDKLMRAYQVLDSQKFATMSNYDSVVYDLEGEKLRVKELKDQLERYTKPIDPEDYRNHYKESIEECLKKTDIEAQWDFCFEKYKVLYDIKSDVIDDISTCIVGSTFSNMLKHCVSKFNAYQKLYQQTPYVYYEIGKTELVTFCSKKEYDKMKDLYGQHEVLCGKRTKQLENKIEEAVHGFE